MMLKSLKKLIKCTYSFFCKFKKNKDLFYNADSKEFERHNIMHNGGNNTNEEFFCEGRLF